MIDLKFSEGQLPGHYESSILLYDNNDFTSKLLCQSLSMYELRPVLINHRVYIAESDLTSSDFIRDNGENGRDLSLSLRSPSFKYLEQHGIHLFKGREIQKTDNGRRIIVRDTPHNFGIL